MMRLLALLLAAPAVGLAGCVRAADPAPALLSLAWGSGEPDLDPGAVEEYRTRLFRFTEDSVAVDAEEAGVLLPVGSGMRRMGVYSRCEFDPVDSTDNIRQAVWETNGAPAPLPPASTCRGQWVDSLESWVSGPACDNHKQRILFASAPLRAEGTLSTRLSECPLMIDKDYQTYPVRDSTGRDVALDEVLTSPELPAAYRRAWEEIVGAPLRAEGFDCAEPAEVDNRNWTIGRREGRWRAFGSVPSHILVECAGLFELPYSVPDSVLGTDNEPAIPWSTLTNGIHGLVDAIVSPDGRWVVAIVADSASSMAAADPFGSRPARLTIYAHHESTFRPRWDGPWDLRWSLVAAQWHTGPRVRGSRE